MELNNSFEVPLPPEAAWPLLMQIEKIAPCMPGTELTEKVDDRTYKGRVNVRLGPVALTFSGTARFEDIDEAAHTARVKASGNDTKGRGTANATVDFRLEPAGTGSKVLVHTNLTLTGTVAQYGRGGSIIQGVAAQLTNEFAKRLQAELASASAPEVVAEHPEAEPAVHPAPAPPPARPISGFALLFRAFWDMLVAAIFGRKQGG